jgi:hypothetical protein
MMTTIGELKASANGSKRAVLQHNGSDVEWKASVKTTMPWQPNSHDPISNTLNFCFRPTAELISYVSDLETDLSQQIACNSELYFGKPLGIDVVKTMFKSALKLSSKGTEHFSVKGRNSNIKFWDKHQKPINEPTVWNGDDEFKIAVRASAVWFSEKGWGISYDLRHMQIFAVDCPFSISVQTMIKSN